MSNSTRFKVAAFITIVGLISVGSYFVLPHNEAEYRAVPASDGSVLSVAPAAGSAPLLVRFSSNRFATHDSAEPQHLIDFGDGSERERINCLIRTNEDYTSSRCIEWGVEHTYASKGTYTAKLIEIAPCFTQSDCATGAQREETVLRKVEVSVR